MSKQSSRLEISWVRVKDGSGRIHLEERWTLAGRRRSTRTADETRAV